MIKSILFTMIHGLKEESKDLQLQAGEFILGRQDVRKYLYQDGRIGKGMIHTVEGSSNMWSIAEEELMERITESSKATVDHFGKQIAYINCLRNMSVSCDCEGVGAEPVVTPNIGILASTDILAIDQASVDLVFALGEDDRKALVERTTTRHGLRQLTYMKEMGMGNDRYHLIDIDNDEITLADAVKDVVPFEG